MHLFGVWGNAIIKHVQPLIKLQIPSHSLMNKEQFYANLGILPFNLLVIHRIDLLHKLTKIDVPKPLLNLYKWNKDIHVHFTTQAHHFHFKRGNTEFVHITFAFQRVYIRNKIILNIDIVVSFTRFISYYIMTFHLDTTNSMSNGISFN